MTYKKIQEILRCAQILRCLKSKYLLFFPARRVFRYAGMDVTPKPWSIPFVIWRASTSEEAEELHADIALKGFFCLD